MTNRSITERLSDIENKLDFLYYNQKPEVSLSHSDFITFYKRVQNEAKNQDWAGCIITLNERFAKSLKNKVLYPDYDSGYWYPIGMEEDMPIEFRDMQYDFLLESFIRGNFKPKTEIATIDAI